MELHRQILIGDVLEQLKQLPADSIDCVVSSPPYWGLRDYGAEGQWGLEPDFHDYLKKMQLFMDGIRRVLKKTGTVWINLGDTYAGSGKGAGTDVESCKESWVFDKKPTQLNNIKAKSRVGIPERFYIDCIDAGWLARNHIPWVKENAMPTSVKDRLQNKWESVFFFAKTGRYYFNLNAIREPPKTGLPKAAKPKAHKIQGQTTLALPEDASNDSKSLHVPGQRPHGITRNRADGIMGYGNKQDGTVGADGKPKPTYVGFNARYKKRAGEPEGHSNIKDRLAHARLVDGLDHDSALSHPLGKNPGDVFFINAKPFLQAHFATFPIDLPLKILKGCGPQQVCSECGEPRFPIMEPSEEYAKLLGHAWHDHNNDTKMGMKQKKDMTSTCADYRITGWTKCDCDKPFQPGVVLDPFFGAGTTAVAAEMLGLNWIGIELKEEYVSDIVKKRLDKYNNKRIESFV